MRLLFIALIFAVTNLLASSDMAAPQGSKEFERMKSLAGVWEGTGKMHSDKDQKIEVDYDVTSGGSVVVEHLFPGTPHEMVSVYHDEKGKLVMTHYCMMGNQPKMGLIKSSDNEIQLSLIPGGTVKNTDTHMHSLALTFNGKNGLTQTWTSYRDGKESDRSVFVLTKKK
jgi:Ni/Co efflux regulator RcnB